MTLWISYLPIKIKVLSWTSLPRWQLSDQVDISYRKLKCKSAGQESQSRSYKFIVFKSKMALKATVLDKIVEQSR